MARSCTFHSMLPFVISLLFVSCAVRLLPLVWSSLPYNIDGLSELRVAEDILTVGNLDFPPSTSHSESYVTDLPILGLLLAFVSSTVGAPPAESTFFTVAMLGAVAVAILAVAFLRFIPNKKAFVAASVSLAIMGSFAFSAGCTWKETLGILMLGIALISFPLRNEPRYRLLLCFPLVLLVFTHHHAAVVSFVLVTFAVLIDAYGSKIDSGRRSTLYTDVAMLAGMWLVCIMYYSSVSLPYLDYLSPGTDLYLFLAVASMVLLLGVHVSTRSKPVSRASMGILVPAIGIFLMLYNIHDPIFPGMPAPSLSIAMPFMAYTLLAIPAWYGVQALHGLNSHDKSLLLAMLLGPLSLIIFAFLRANDATSHLVVYRTFDFLIIPFALLVGVGFAYLIRNRGRLSVLAGISIVVICASTLPVAYQTQELFGVQNHTFDFEYDAVEWFSENGVSSYTSDQRLGETGWRLFDIDYGRGLPYDLREGLSLNSSSFYVLEEQWSTNGAQEFPFGVVIVDEDVIADVMSSSSVLYIGGPEDDQLVLFTPGL